MVEDDLRISPVFLDYMNRALDRYEDDQRVMQISGHMFPVDLPDEVDAVFLPFTTSWGWATWRRAWEKFDPDMHALETLKHNRSMRIKFDLDGAYPYYRMLQQQVAGRKDSWAIRWYLSVFSSDGIVLYPKESMVDNRGFDGSGTHCDVRHIKNNATLLRESPVIVLPEAELNNIAFTEVKRFLRSENSFLPRAQRGIARLVRAGLRLR